LVKSLKENLTNIPSPTEIESIQDFDMALNNLNQAIQEAIEKHVNGLAENQSTTK